MDTFLAALGGEIDDVDEGKSVLINDLLLDKRVTR